MTSAVGVRELKTDASRIVREVREERAEYVITYRGEPVALPRPLSKDDALRVRAARRTEALAELSALTDEISAAWCGDEDALENLARSRSERCR